METKKIIGTGLKLTAIVTALIAYSGCSKKTNNPVSNQEPDPVVSYLTLNTSSNEDSAYCRVKVTATEPCSVYVDIQDGDSTLVKKGAYLTDSTEFLFSNLKRPLDGIVRAYGPNSPDTLFHSLIFPDSGVTSVGGANDTLPAENRSLPIDSTTPDTTIVDTNRVTPVPDTSIVDTSGDDNADPNQGMFKIGAKGKKKEITLPKPKTMYARQNLFYKPRQYVRA